MSSNVEFQCCPACFELNSAEVWCFPDLTYKIGCRECGYEFESGHLPWESVQVLDMDVWEESDEEDVYAAEEDRLYGDQNPDPDGLRITGNDWTDRYDRHENKHIPGYYIDAMSRDNPTNEDPD